MNRFFTAQKLSLGQTVPLEAAIEKHVVKVLRLTVGSRFELAHDGQAFLATLVAIEPALARLEQEITRPVELPVATTIVCGVGKGEKAEWITQKATELGAAQILFFNGEWGTAKWSEARIDKKLKRLTAVAQGAAEQSHRNYIPAVGFLPALGDLTTRPADAKLIAYEESAKAGEGAVLVQTLAKRPTSLVVVFGPEGGLSPAEVTMLTGSGFTAAGLGPRIMRTETAPLYLLAAVSALTELQGEKHA